MHFCSLYKKGAALVSLLFCFTFSVFSLNPDFLNTLTIINKSEKPIYYLFISPGDSEYWGPEILGSERSLNPEDTLSFYIHYAHNCDNFDIIALTEENIPARRLDYEICDGTKAEITLRTEDFSGEPPAFSYIEVTIANKVKTPLYHLFFSPADSIHWGVDFLDQNTTLADNQNATYLVPQPSEGDRRYDILGMDKSGKEYRVEISISDTNAEFELNKEYQVEPIIKTNQ